jgi:hypothetical protein
LFDRPDLTCANPTTDQTNSIRCVEKERGNNLNSASLSIHPRSTHQRAAINSLLSFSEMKDEQKIKRRFGWGYFLGVRIKMWPFPTCT